MATFRAISWNPHELISEAKMDRLSANMDYLYNATPRVTYKLDTGLTRTEGMKILAGRVTVGPQKTDNGTARVTFGNFFTSGCQPIITTGIYAAWMPKMFCTIGGIGRIVPDHTGFIVYLNVASDVKKNDRLSKTTYVGWQAIGY